MGLWKKILRPQKKNLSAMKSYTKTMMLRMSAMTRYHGTMKWRTKTMMPRMRAMTRYHGAMKWRTKTMIPRMSATMSHPDALILYYKNIKQVGGNKTSIDSIRYCLL